MREAVTLLSHYSHGEGVATEPVERGDLVAAMVPCPGRMIRGGVGGAAMTSCAWCGEVMASTAGPHSADGETVKVMVVREVVLDRSGRQVVFTRPLTLGDLRGGAPDTEGEADDAR